MYEHNTRDDLNEEDVKACSSFRSNQRPLKSSRRVRFFETSPNKSPLKVEFVHCSVIS